MGFARIVRRCSHACVCGAWLAGCGAAAWAANGAAGKGSGQRHGVEISPWEQAERARDAFESEPENRRTRAEYTRVMDGFRAVYHDAPQDLHAAESVNAVAELLAEEGRGERNAKLLKAAVGQYEFLRTQYPGSSLRVGALLAQGQIEENDLHDAAAARERYQMLLKLYPRSALAEEARAGVASVDAGRGAQPETGREQGAGNREQLARGLHGAGAVAGGREENSARRDGAAMNGAPDGRSGSSGVVAKGVRDGGSAGHPRGSDPILSDGKAVGEVGASGLVPRPSIEAAAAPVAKPVVRRTGPPAAVTGIRHWSTPSYTRVAIDLGGEVEYEAARVPAPDRIYFDLHGARLAPELVGKSFAVTDDGFLKKIRVAQSSGDVARVVLDVNDVTEYSAFLLPNPYRLIIDIHGGSKGREQATGVREQAATDDRTGQREGVADAPSPRTAPIVNVTAAKPVPNTVTQPSTSTTADVARLSNQPGKVEATSVPTSQPISAVVPGRSREQGSGSREQPAAGQRRAIVEEGSQGSVVSSQTAADRGVLAPQVADGGRGSTQGGETRAGTTRRGKKAKASDAKVVGDPAMPARAAVPTADGQTSLVRALGLKIGRIVIDAGHGGHDSGTIGADGIEEKDVVLDVALRVGKLLHERLGAEVIYTRSDDTFIPLETRTAIANKAQADLFLSIHANSSADASARGVETYYLNFTQQADALAVAARENAVSNQSIYQLSDLVKKIALKDKIAESREFAVDVEASLYSGLAKGNVGLKNRGVKKAPFVVLIGANMPSILAEISFVTNPTDASQLREPEYRERVAESLYRGVARYAGGLSGTRPATVAVAQRTGGQ